MGTAKGYNAPMLAEKFILIPINVSWACPELVYKNGKNLGLKGK